jgi:AcrR family transcriptional regulator
MRGFMSLSDRQKTRNVQHSAHQSGSTVYRLGISRMTAHRARSEADKEQRRVLIFSAARDLGLRHGVPHVTLGDIAREVGLAKSSILRYFETREEIYLLITAEEWRDWSEAVRAALPPTTLEAAAVADVLTNTLADRPLFCDLLAHTPANLEHNVSARAIRMARIAAWTAIRDLSLAIVACLPEFSRRTAADLVLATSLLAGAIWLRANPPSSVFAAYRNHPHPSDTSLVFTPSLRRLVSALIAGTAAPVDGGCDQLLAYASPPFFERPADEPPTPSRR